MAQETRRPAQRQNDRQNDQQQQTQSQERQQRSSAPVRSRGQGRQVAEQGPDLQTDLLKAVTPAFQEAREYIENSPVAAAAIGAIAGGLLMTLVSTEKGRSFARAAYDYANPMVAKYARDYISQIAGDMAENAVAH